MQCIERIPDARLLTTTTIGAMEPTLLFLHKPTQLS